MGLEDLPTNGALPFGWIKNFCNGRTLRGRRTFFLKKTSGGLLFCTFWTFFSRPSWKVTIFCSGRVFFVFPIFCLVLHEGLQFECRFVLSFFSLHHPKPELLRYERLYTIVLMDHDWAGVGEFTIH